MMPKLSSDRAELEHARARRSGPGVSDCAAADRAAEACRRRYRRRSPTPDLLERRALDLGEADLEHDLLRRAERQHVDDLARAHRSRRSAPRGRRRAALDTMPVEDQRIVGNARADLVAGHQFGQLPLQRRDIGADHDVDHRDQHVARGRTASGWWCRSSCPARRASSIGQRQDVGDLGIADQRLGDRAGRLRSTWLLLTGTSSCAGVNAVVGDRR